MVSEPAEHARAIAVFGSSEPRPGQPDYGIARELGRRLAAAGLTVLTGGYGGVMEAASRGAREAGGRTVGVTCAIFAERRPNAWLDEIVCAGDLHTRTRELVDRAAGYVVLPGKAGTLAELAQLWALERAGCLDERHVVLLGEFWEPLLHTLRRSGMLEPSQLQCTHLARSPAEAVELMARPAAQHRPEER